MKVLLIVTIIFSVAFNISCSSNIDKAKDLIKAKMFKEAIPILNESISKSPTNPESHFLLGECYLNEGQLSQAYKSFERAISLDSGYSSIVGDTFFELAAELLKKGRDNEAYRFFSKSAEIEPSNKDKISDFYYELGKGTSIQESLKVVSLLDTATKFSQVHNEDISTYLYDSGIKLQSSSDLKNAITFFEKCAMLFPEKRMSISEHMLNTASDIIKTNPDNATKFMKLSLQFNESSSDKIISMIKENRQTIEKKGHSTTVNLLYDLGNKFRTHKVAMSKMIFNIAKREENLDEIKSFSAYYSKATSLNKEFSRCPEIDCAYYYALDMWIKGKEKSAEKEFYKMFKKSPSSKFVRKLQKQLAPTGDIAYLKPDEKKLIATVYEGRNFFWLSTGKVELSTSAGKNRMVDVNNGVYYTGLGNISREGTKVFVRNPNSKAVSIFYVIASGISYN